jgi:CDP-diacylglycerol--glycerol-3-phosphate 3-phosphatidyltransferase
MKKAVQDWMDPVADSLIRAGLRPNGITTLSIIVLLASGIAFGLGALRLGAFLLLFSGVFDILDGKVARRGNMSTKFGAFYDSTMDRAGDAAIFAGLGVYFIHTPGQRLPVLGLGLCFAALCGAFLVSYARARAEGLGLDCKVGFAQRAERIVFLGVPTMIWGAGRHGWLLLGILFVLTGVNFVTVVQRIVHVYRTTASAEPLAAAPPPRLSPLLDPVAKGS